MFFPPILPAHGSLEPPPGYHLETDYNRGLFFGGLVVFGAGYGIAIGYGAANGFSEGLGLLAIPIIGPFAAIGQRDLDCSIGPVTPGVDPTVEVNACQKKLVSEATTIATLSAIGVVELFGAGLTVIGLLDRDKSWVRNDIELGSLRFRPLVLPSGAAIAGTF